MTRPSVHQTSYFPAVTRQGWDNSFDDGFCHSQRPVRMTAEVFQQIQERIGRYPAEEGGMLGGSREEPTITQFHFDDSARTSSATYTPDHQTLSSLLKNDWNPVGIRLKGFVHSHPGRFQYLSGGDRDYARRILEACPHIAELYLPIVLPATRSWQGESEMEMHMYVATIRAGRLHIEKRPIEIVAAASRTELDVHVAEAVTIAESETVTTTPTSSPAIEAVSITKPLPEETSIEVSSLFPLIREEYSGPLTSALCHKVLQAYEDAHGRSWIDTSVTFSRVHSAYDLPHLSRCRMVIVGAGGAASFVEECARAGVTEFTLIDGDVVSETNLATQQVYRRDIGRPKVDCIRDRILDINPNAIVQTHPVMLDELDDNAMEAILLDPIGSDVVLSGQTPWSARVTTRPRHPGSTLLCGLTDSFPAQARINRLGLHFGVPTMNAQVYLEGLGAEITFTHPQVTPACHRCALSSRYHAYRSEGFRNDVTSNGTPIFSTTRLNALKGQIAMAILHHGTGHPRWDRMLRRIGNRNLIQIRMAPNGIGELTLPAFDRAFRNADRRRVLCDDVVWLPQKPKGPEHRLGPCPECGGSGDLSLAFGTFKDTRHWNDGEPS